MIEFIFMLTHDDATVPNALEVLDEVRDTGLTYVGFKDIGASPEALREIAAAAHQQGLDVMLEVVSTSVEDEIRSLEAAAEIGVDWVLGGTHPEEGLRVLNGTEIRYCPFPGRIVGHPSVLEGEIEEIAEDARRLTAHAGVYGLDLLAYRHRTADIGVLTRRVVEASAGPVIAAGSVVGDDQIATLEQAGAWGFTIGSAIFEKRIPGAPSVADQVRHVLDVASGT